jgi:hypothetical protein
VCVYNERDSMSYVVVCTCVNDLSYTYMRVNHRCGSLPSSIQVEVSGALLLAHSARDQTQGEIRVYWYV